MRQRGLLQAYPIFRILGDITLKIDPIEFRAPIGRTTEAGRGASSVAPVTTPRSTAPRPASGVASPGTGTGTARSAHQNIEAHPGTDHGPGGDRDNVHRARADRLHPRGPAPTPRPTRARTRITGQGSNQPP